MALVDDFKARFPEFTDAVADQYVPILEPVWPAYYGRKYDAGAREKEAVLNLIAHLLTLETKKGAQPGKAEASKSVGSVSVSYDAATATGGAMHDFFSSTKYGQRFLTLNQSQRGGYFV